MKMLESLRDFGQTMNETDLKAALQKLNPDLHFDVGGRMDLYHPNISTRQNVYWNLRHVCAMERGAAIPEFNVWAVVTRKNGNKERSHILRVGWRHTLEAIVRSGVPGVTWERLRQALNVEPKEFVGDPKELTVVL